MKWLKIASIVVIGLVLAVFALMGILFAFRGTPTRAVAAFGDPAGPPAVGDSTFLRTTELLTHTQLFGGNSVELLNNGNETYPRIYADLHAARRSITMQMYYSKPGVVADSFKNILIERARAGVRVLVLLDAFGSGSITSQYLDSLRAAHVRVALFRPVTWHTLHKAQNRSHVRALTIDEHVGYTGGFGLADYWLGDGHHDEQWRDSNVRFTGPAVLQLQAAFAVAWSEATGELLTGRFLFGEPQPADTANHQVAGLFYAVPTLGSTSAERFIALSIAGAKHSLYVTNAYLIPDEAQRKMLEAAARRGVDVRLLTAGPKTDVATVRHASHAYYEELLRAGVRIFEYQPTMLHAKTLVVDGIWSTVGTMNFDNRSITLNEESNLLVSDTAFAQRMQQVFLDDLRYSHEYHLSSFARRSIFSKLLDGAASHMAKLL